MKALVTLILCTIAALFTSACSTAPSTTRHASANLRQFTLPGSKPTRTSKQLGERTQSLNDPFIIGVMNTSDYTITEVSIDGGGTFHPTTVSVGQTCTATTPAGEDECFKQKRWVPIATISCDSIVRLVLKAQKPVPQGTATMTTEFEQFHADCGKKGKVVVHRPN